MRYFHELRTLDNAVETMTSAFGIDGYLRKAYLLRRFTLSKVILEKLKCPYDIDIPPDYEFSPEEKSQVEELRSMFIENYQFPKQ